MRRQKNEEKRKILFVYRPPITITKNGKVIARNATRGINRSLSVIEDKAGRMLTRFQWTTFKGEEAINHYIHIPKGFLLLHQNLLENRNDYKQQLYNIRNQMKLKNAYIHPDYREALQKFIPDKKRSIYPF